MTLVRTTRSRTASGPVISSTFSDSRSDWIDSTSFFEELSSPPTPAEGTPAHAVLTAREMRSDAMSWEHVLGLACSCLASVKIWQFRHHDKL